MKKRGKKLFMVIGVALLLLVCVVGGTLFGLRVLSDKKKAAIRGIPLRKHRSKKGKISTIPVLRGLEIAPLFL